MDKSLSQSTISKSKPVSSSSESEDDCDNKCKTKRETIQSVHFKNHWKMDYLASDTPDRSKPQCLICYEIMSENKKSSVKRHYLSKHSTNIEKNFIY